MKLILLESEATVVVTDVLGFNQLAEKIGPMELGIVLSAYYEHVGGAIERHGGRIVKFLGDGVLAAFVGGAHEEKAVAALAELDGVRPAWLADNAKVGLPNLDYAIGVATGPVLTGELGTDAVHFWDVLGAPVNLAFRLCALASDRGLSHLVAARTVQPQGRDEKAGRARFVEVDAAELAGHRQRLYRLDA